MVSPMELLRSRWPLPTTAHLRHFRLPEKTPAQPDTFQNQGDFNPLALSTLQTFPHSIHHPWVAEVCFAKSRKQGILGPQQTNSNHPTGEQ